MTTKTALRNIVLGILQEALDRDEMVPLHAKPLAGLSLAQAPPRLTVRREAVDMLALLAGFSGPDGSLAAAMDELRRQAPPP